MSIMHVVLYFVMIPGLTLL